MDLVLLFRFLLLLISGSIYLSSIHLSENKDEDLKLKNYCFRVSRFKFLKGESGGFF